MTNSRVVDFIAYFFDERIERAREFNVLVVEDIVVEWPTDQVGRVAERSHSQFRSLDAEKLVDAVLPSQLLAIDYHVSVSS